jgi:transcriptional regulator with XRE-family HTH domain
MVRYVDMEVDTMRLKELRIEKMLSQDELHQRSGVARDTISRLERGKGEAQYRTIRKLADALEIPYRELLKKG